MAAPSTLEQMRRVLPIIAGLLVYVMTPGALELTENALHLLRHGDTAHADAKHAPDGPNDEHGCSGSYHACTCHSSPQFVSGPSAPTVPPPTDVARTVVLGPADMLADGFPRGIDRPPQA